MKKTKLLLLFLTSLLLASCGAREETPTSQEDSLPIPSETTGGQDETSTKPDSGPDNPLPVIEGKLQMFGELYADSSRDVFLRMEEIDSKEHTVVWESSDTSIFTVSDYLDQETSIATYLAKNKYVKVASLSGKKAGTATLKATLDGEKVYTKEVTVLGDGLTLSEDVYESIMYGMKLVGKESEYDFGQSVTSATLDSEKNVTTIYEEKNPETKNYVDEWNIENINHTDCYSLNDGKKSYNYYRSSSNKVGTEYITSMNTIGVQPILNSNGEEISMDNSYYINQFNTGYVSHGDFKSFDNGATYHYVGGYVGSMYIAISILLRDIAVDDLWFTVKDGVVDTINFQIDPIISSDGHFYGLKYGAYVQDINTAKAPHLSLLERTEDTEKIENAFKALKKNYKQELTIDYQDGDSDDITYTYIFEEDNVDLVNSKENIHTGYHKVDDKNSYYYSYDPSTELVKIKQEYAYSLEELGLYKTFDSFAKEIFQKTGTNNVYSVIANANSIIYDCAIFPKGFGMMSFDKTYLYLNDDGSMKAMTSVATLADPTGTDDLVANITIRFSEIGTAKCNIDFSKIDDSEEPLPSNWKDANESIFNQLEEWELTKYFPYVACKVGWDSAHPRQASSSDSGYYEYIVVTKQFKNDEETLAFLAEYIKAIESSGYTKTGNKITETTNSYTISADEYKSSDGKYYMYARQSSPTYGYNLYRVEIHLFAK